MENREVNKYSVERRNAIRIQECWAYRTSQPKEYNIKIAETLEELCLAFEFMGIKTDRLENMMQFLPHHIILLGRHEKEPIALLSMYISSSFGLPVYKQYPDIAGQVKKICRKPAEIHCLRFIKDVEYKGILFDLMSIAWFVAGFCGVDSVIFSEQVHGYPIPELLEFYSFQRHNDIFINYTPEFEGEFIEQERRRFDADLYKFFSKQQLMERDMMKWQRTIFTPSILAYFLKNMEIDKGNLRNLMFYYPSWDFSTILTRDQLKSLGYPFHEQDPSPGDRIYQ